MDDDLFPTTHAPSPRLKWQERHGLSLYKNEAGNWVVKLDDDNWVEADDPDDAAWGFCRVTGIKHYAQL